LIPFEESLPIAVPGSMEASSSSKPEVVNYLPDEMQMKSCGNVGHGQYLPSDGQITQLIIMISGSVWDTLRDKEGTGATLGHASIVEEW